MQQLLHGGRLARHLVSPLHFQPKVVRNGSCRMAGHACTCLLSIRAHGLTITARETHAAAHRIAHKPGMGRCSRCANTHTRPPAPQGGSVEPAVRCEDMRMPSPRPTPLPAGHQLPKNNPQDEGRSPKTLALHSFQRWAAARCRCTCGIERPFQGHSACQVASLSRHITLERPLTNLSYHHPSGQLDKLRPL